MGNKQEKLPEPTPITSDKADKAFEETRNQFDTSIRVDTKDLKTNTNELTGSDLTETLRKISRGFY